MAKGHCIICTSSKQLHVITGKHTELGEYGLCKVHHDMPDVDHIASVPASLLTDIILGK